MSLERPPSSTLSDPNSRFVVSAPLFEEERNVLFDALVAHARRPFGLHRPRAVTGLPAHDHPANILEVELERAKERLT